MANLLTGPLPFPTFQPEQPVVCVDVVDLAAMVMIAGPKRVPQFEKIYHIQEQVGKRVRLKEIPGYWYFASRFKAVKHDTLVPCSSEFKQLMETFQ